MVSALREAKFVPQIVSVGPDQAIVSVGPDQAEKNPDRVASVWQPDGSTLLFRLQRDRHGSAATAD